MALLRSSLILFCALTTAALAADTGHDWTQFSWDVNSSGVSNDPTGITAANAGSMVRHQVHLSGIADSSPIYLHDVSVKGAKHNVLFVTTAYGRTIAVDADKDTTLWEYAPAKIAAWDGTRQIMNGTPAADPDRQHIYVTAPDGVVRKLSIADGSPVWETPITLLPSREKMDSALKVFRGHVYAVTGGYIGDQPPYQGHIAILDAKDGKLLHVWNSLCSDRPVLLQPDSCPSVQSAIWGRSGAVIDPATGNIFFATGNGPWNGRTDWGDALIELNPDATKMLGNYTPANNDELRRRDLDIGSTSPALLGGGWLAQGGKDLLIRVMTIQSIAGSDPHENDSPSRVPTPSSARFLTSMAVWHHSGDTLLFAADDNSTEAWKFKDGKLTQLWKDADGGTSPLMAGGLLYVYNPAGGLNVLDPLTGKKISTLECGRGHWNSPIVVDGIIALPEGGNRMLEPGPGILNIWTLPGK
jgi:outer membrane protein assembly factor BamB